MKTIVEIKSDYDADGAYHEFIDEVSFLVNEIELHCEVSNDRFTNVVEQRKNYFVDKSKFKNKTIVEAKGYSQGDWQEYTLYHNEPKDSAILQSLVDELEKTFTHMNDYIAEIYEQTEVDGKLFNAEPHDYIHFSIRHTEFPEKDDVLGEFESLYDLEYDEIIINID